MTPSAKYIVIATPHRRNDALVDEIRKRLPDYEIVRVARREDLQPESLRQMAPSWIFFPHWSWIIQPEVHQQFRCVIFHMTDVPYGRGGSPLQNLIVRGHAETMLTALQCTSEVDAGPVFLKKSLCLAGTAEEILTRAASLMPDMIFEIVTSSPDPVPQTGPVVAFKRRTPDEGNVAALQELAQVYDHIRMLDGDGYPPAFVEVGKLRIELTSALLGEDAVEAKAKIRRKP